MLQAGGVLQTLEQLREGVHARLGPGELLIGRGCGLGVGVQVWLWLRLRVGLWVGRALGRAEATGRARLVTVGGILMSGVGFAIRANPCGFRPRIRYFMEDSTLSGPTGGHYIRVSFEGNVGTEGQGDR